MYYCNCNNVPPWQNMPYYPYAYTPYPYLPRTSQEDEDEGKAHACLPLEEFGIPASICAKISMSPLQAEIYLRVVGFTEITLGTVTLDSGILSIDVGATISPLGIGTGIGATLNVQADAKSGCISACVEIDYGVGSVAPLYGIIGGTCLNPVLTPSTS